MKTVRRLYFYAVAFIILEVVLWGLIDLARSILDQTVGGATETLARALALVLVGVPIFLFHWLWTQRASSRDDEERTATLRAIFFYGVLLSTLIPAVQNLLGYLDRTFLDLARLNSAQALIGGQQTLADNLVAILMNGVVAAYFWNLLRGEWKTLPVQDDFADVRRLYRYIWVLYGLAMVVFGTQQILRFLFYGPSDVLGDVGRQTAINGLALLVVGTPLWLYAWCVVQNSLTDSAEHESNLRLGVLYLLALGGVITVLTTSAMTISIILNKLLGADMTSTDFIRQISGPLSVGLPLGAVWAYYGHRLTRHIESIGDEARQAGMKRVYFYILSALGLGGAFIGLATLIKFMIDLLTGGTLILDNSLRDNLSTAISLIAAWLPLWLLTWRPMQAQALAEGETGDRARRSVMRRTYLYLALFAGVIGGMSAAVALAFELLRALLSGTTEGNFLATVLNELQLLILFVVLLIYHLTNLRRDGGSIAHALAARHGQYSVLVVDPGDGSFADSVRAALIKYAPRLLVGVVAASGEPRQDAQFDAVILPGSLAVRPTKGLQNWLSELGAPRLIVRDEVPDIIWADGVGKASIQDAARAVRQLADGQEIRGGARGRSGWTIVVYVAAALFGLEVLSLLVAVVFSAFVR